MTPASSSATCNLANDPATLVPVLGALPPGTPVAFEAAYGWGWLVELLEELELEPHLVHPSRCKAIASARLKNDKVDAATLAQLLRADLLPGPGSHRSRSRDLRALLRHRASLVRLSTSCKNRVHAVLADRGIPDRAFGPVRAGVAGRPRASADPAGDHPGLLWAAGCPGHPDRLAGTPDRRAGQARPQGPGADGPARGRQAHRETLVAEIGDIARFPTARKLCAWAGLTPQVRNSDRKVRHGHITKKARRGCVGSFRRPPRRPSATPCSLPPMASWPAAAAPTSPPPRSPGGCWPLLPHPDPARDPADPPEKASTGRARVSA